MPRGRKYGLLIAGGGVAGSLAALALAKLRPDLRFLLVGEESAFGGGNTLIVDDAGLGDEERALLAPLISHSWDACYAAFPGRSRKLKLIRHCLIPERIDQAVRETLRPDQYRLDAKIVAVRDRSLLLHGGETIAADGAVDARDATHLPALELGWRVSAARAFRFAAPHRVDLPVAVDATLEQKQGCRFFSLLPFSAERLLVEEVRYAAVPDVDAAAAGARIEAYAARRGWKHGVAEGEEGGALPVALGGDFTAYWRLGGARVAKLGARGGFFHPFTGCPLPDALGTALLLAGQRDFGGEALHDTFEAHAMAAWKKRDFHRSFNRRMIEGPGCAALAGLYGLDAALIARFFGEELGMLDRRKIMAAAGR